MIDVYASQPNYWRHLAPIVDELRERGHDVETWARHAWQPWGRRISEALHGDLTVVASFVDARKADGLRVVYVEHGAGQTYVDGRPQCYAGSPDLDHVVLFLGPGEHVSERWRASYPQAAVETVGCPALDQHLHAYARNTSVNDKRPRVVISAHWACGTTAETRPALFEFERGISELARLEGQIELVGHAHPRSPQRTRRLWDRLGIPFEVDPDSVLRTADLLVHDNSSLMYEAAACDVPVLALNARGYRRDVEHGLRFWSHVPGLQCDDNQKLVSSLLQALDDPPWARALRARAAEHVYAHRDGSSARRAADAIERIL